jgi:hypothetical protein
MKQQSPGSSNEESAWPDHLQELVSMAQRIVSRIDDNPNSACPTGLASVSELASVNLVTYQLTC